MSSTCPQDVSHLGAYVDGELDAVNIALVEAHIARCNDCRGEVERLEALRALLGNDELRHEAPASLKRDILQRPELSALQPRTERRLPSWLAPGIAGALAASLGMILIAPRPADSGVEQQLVSSHVRSLQPGHLIDVETSDRHVVKPWFNGRVDFSPPVPELAPAGFPLVGGRLDSIDGKTVAAIVYHRRLHRVNLFVWKADRPLGREITTEGYSLREWSDAGLQFAAVSDIPADELRQFESLYRRAAAGAPAAN